MQRYPNAVLTRLPDDEYDTIRSLAFIKRTSISELVREYVVKALDEEMDADGKKIKRAKSLMDAAS